MGIEFKSNIDTTRLKGDMVTEVERRLGRAIEELTTEIVIRSRSGRGFNGETFVSLSPKYQRYKQKKGRRGVPDLTFSGRMLAAITSSVTKLGKVIEGKIFFNSAKEAAKARGNQRLRKFFGLSRAQIQRLVELMRGK